MRIYQLDAFTDKVFGGNPAAVCPLQHWPSDELMQHIAAENNLAETAFYVPTQNGFHIRWFTPTVEVDLCGHATLATAYVVFFEEQYEKEIIEFESRSGILRVKKEGDWLVLDFPADVLKPTLTPPDLLEGLGGIQPIEVLKGKSDYLVLLDNQAEISNLKPNFSILASVPARGVIVTAQGNDVDFVSRFFAPQSGIDEDPVTGSAHTSLTVYWASKLNKNEFTAQQISKRGGFLKTKLVGDRVEIAGQVRLYMKGEIYV
jgi:PhzF family phenazine biosynthesis protein